MFKLNDYTGRAYNFVHNKIFPGSKRLSSLMIYATDVCDSGCKHCLIWAKRPTTCLSFEAIKKIMGSQCISSSTMVGLEGGEFLLHPEADEIMQWFSQHHKNFDLFSNCLQPDKLITAVKRFRPHRLYISLDGDRETYQQMRGKDGYDRVIRVIETLHAEVPVFVMFTLSPYNDFNDLEHVARVCEKYKVFLRVGIYNNIPFFDTIDDSKRVHFGQLKNQPSFSYREAVALRESRANELPEQQTEVIEEADDIPAIIKKFPENYDYVRLYQNWKAGDLHLKCRSILDSVIVLPDGEVPICQHLELKLGNIHHNTLDEIFNSKKSSAIQEDYSQNCNQCWVSYHRKYDIILYRNFERFFGKKATLKLLGYYKWDADGKLNYEEVLEPRNLSKIS